MAEWKVSEVFGPDKLNINQWSEEDRPREKLGRLGAEALSSAELLAILIGSGSPKENAVELMQKVLHGCGNSLKALGRMSVDDLKQYNGIGEAKAITILAACELGKRRQQENALERLDLSCAESIYEYLRPKMQDLATEEAWILLLNHNFKLIGDAVRISQGGLTETAVDVRLIVKHAILGNATVVVLAHNHPSGNARPSRNDDNITRQVGDALKLMRLHLADHIIITDGNYYSYQENGKL
ncbi:MAG: DNA repair protein RadC [Prevotella sp.]|nr:DNA repair protein RadC [Prevotella sp.]MBQ9093509.1 DNA repair protein RadC [Prevotella sp.]